MAAADWFKALTVHEIDISGWSGEIGQTIQVKAQDDTYVAKVHVVVRDENGILEEGVAVLGDGLWWNYTTTTQVTISGQTQILATAQDLARNTAEFTYD